MIQIGAKIKKDTHVTSSFGTFKSNWFFRCQGEPLSKTLSVVTLRNQDRKYTERCTAKGSFNIIAFH